VLPDWPRRIGAAWIFADKNRLKTMWVRGEAGTGGGEVVFIMIIECLHHRRTIDPHPPPLPVKTYHDLRDV
jgi:hypothetical protein